MCFSFSTLDTLFQHCQHIKSLCINFKYLQIKAPNKYLVDQCIHSWPVNRLEKLYLKNVCDMKTRRFNNLKYSHSAANSHSNPATSYDLIEMEIIKLIRILFRRNSSSLRVLGLKCVDPNIISSCVNDFGNLEILLLNNINDTDSVLQELAYVCKNLKCLELNKCREFQGDGLQEIIDQCVQLETLELGKHVYPTMSELTEINWSNLKHQLKELSITTKFPSNDQYGSSGSSSSGSVSSSYTSNSSLISSHSSSSSRSSTSSIDVYSRTIFNYLSESNYLEYLALADFTLRFPAENFQIDSSESASQPLTKKIRLDSQSRNGHNLNSNLKYLYLRNIRNIKRLTNSQIFNLKVFLNTQHNLHTLDLIGLYLDSKFLCSILSNLNNLRIFNFGHGKSYKKSISSSEYLRHQMFFAQKTDNFKNDGSSFLINIDDINLELSKSCSNLTNLGIFYRQSELEFKKDGQVECKNNALMTLLDCCSNMKEISYLKSFKVQDDDDDDANMDEMDDEDEDYSDVDEYQKRNKKKRSKSYFHYIKYAITNTSQKSTHVNMQPCYGFDITPSSGHLLDIKNLGFIETSLPVIRPPNNDFHVNVLRI